MDEKVEVRITGDASSAASAFKVSEEAAARALALMVEHFRNLGIISTEEMAKTGAAAEHGAAKTEVAATRFGAATAIMKHHFHEIGEEAEVLKGKFEIVAGTIERFNTVLMGISALLIGGALFNESIGAATNLVTETNRLSSAFGLSLEKASGLHEALHTLGIESDTAAMMAMKLSRQVKTHEDALNADGVATRNAAGDHLNLYQIMQNGIDRLREMKPGYDRNAVAIDLFGRGAGDLTKLLRLNDEAMKDGMETAKALGIVVTKDGVDSTVAYQHAVAEAKSVIEALWVAVGQALIPVIKELADMLKNNGTNAVQTIRSAIEGLINIVRIIVSVFATFDLAISVIAGALAALGQVAYTTGKIVYDALTLHWGAIEGDWQAGFNNLKQIAHDAAAQIKADWAASNMGWIGGAKGSAGSAHGGNEANPDTGDTLADKVTKEKGTKATKDAKGGDDSEKFMADAYRTATSALDKYIAEQEKAATTRRQITAEDVKGTEARSLLEITSARTIADEQVKAGKISTQQRLVLEQQFATAEYTLKRKALSDEMALSALDPKSAVNTQKLYQQLLTLQKAYEIQSAKLSRDAQARSTAGWHAAASSMAQSWGQAIGKMATMQQSFGATLNNMWGSIVNMFAGAVARMVEMWLISLVSKEAASKGFHMKQTLMDAKEAASGAYKAVVGIPFVGPALAPVAAGVAFAGVMAFSAKDGYDVPANVGRGIDGMGGQIGIVHPREMILPAETADRFRNGGGGRGGGDTYHVHMMDTRGAKDFLDRNAHHVAGAVKLAVRNGKR
jgi:hypothetical protein